MTSAEPPGQPRAPEAAKRRDDLRSHRWFGVDDDEHISQADQGCDFDFLEGAGNPEPAIH